MSGNHQYRDPRHDELHDMQEGHSYEQGNRGHETSRGVQGDNGYRLQIDDVVHRRGPHQNIWLAYDQWGGQSEADHLTTLYCEQLEREGRTKGRNCEIGQSSQYNMDAPHSGHHYDNRGSSRHDGMGHRSGSSETESYNSTSSVGTDSFVVNDHRGRGYGGIDHHIVGFHGPSDFQERDDLSIYGNHGMNDHRGGAYGGINHHHMGFHGANDLQGMRDPRDYYDNSRSAGSRSSGYDRNPSAS